MAVHGCVWLCMAVTAVSAVKAVATVMAVAVINGFSSCPVHDGWHTYDIHVQYGPPPQLLELLQP